MLIESLKEKSQKIAASCEKLDDDYFNPKAFHDKRIM